MMNYRAELSNEQLRAAAPSAFATQPYEKMSSRYTFIPTSAVIDGMRAAGFAPVQATQSRCRIAEKQDFTKHMIRFRTMDSIATQAIVGNTVAEIVMVNSHDGASRYKLLFGLFRFTCTNGMMVSDGEFESVNIRHSGNVIGEVIDGASRIVESAPRVLDTVRRWQTIELRESEQKLLAAAAHTVRFPITPEEIAEGKKPTPILPEQLLRARRTDDAKPDLWSTFNRIQENALKGVKAYTSNWQRVSSRPVKGIDGDVKLNRALWTLAEEMAKLKTA